MPTAIHSQPRDESIQRKPWAGVRKCLALTAAVGVIATGLSTVQVAPAVAATGDPVTGTIWQDYDSNGILDTFEDSGRLEGVEVRAYDGAGNVAGPVLTAADGTYSLPVTSDAARWRVEANVPDTPQWEAWEGSVVGRSAGTSNGTTVQFVDVPAGGATGVDFSFQVPGAYVENNPLVFLPAYRYGASDGAQGERFGGTAHLYDAMSASSQATVPTTWNVPFSEVGATFGTAWQQASAPGELGSLFTSAYVRRHSGLGPEGIGAIYRVAPDDGTPTSPTASASLLVDLAASGIDLGSDSDAGAVTGDPNGLRPKVTADNPAYDWQRDAQAWDTVGRVGLGGMEISTDQRYLFAVNLYKRSLVRVEIDRTGTSVVGVEEFELDAYFPDGSDLRPFGLSSNPLTNELYLTVTNTAETSQQRADLHAHVYAFSPENPSDLSEVLDFSLGYQRGAGWAGFSANYQPWSTDPAKYAPYYNGDTMAASVPIVSDARFLHGDLVIGIRALDGDIFGSYTYLSADPADSRTVRARTNGGELLLAGGNGDGTFTIEQNGVVNGAAGAGAGAGSLLNGPTGPNKYFVDQWWGGPEHLGAVLVVPSRPDGVLETGIHVAEGAFQVGTRRLYQGNGSVVEPRGAAIVTGTNVLGVTTKGNGLGELTALASAAPIEIGNYVWYDVDHDGIQDPDETPVPGATVNLYEVAGDGARTLVSSTTTSAIGEYYFSSEPTLNANGYALKTNTDYVVGVDNPADYADGGALFGWYPTLADKGEALSPDPDRNDSDGLVEESDAGAFPFAAITTGGPGANDHTIDFGYSQLDYEFTKRTVEGPTENPDDDGTWSVTYELVVENPSDVDGAYRLTDDLAGYGEGIEVVDTEVVSGPDGAALNPAWDGLADTAVITERLPIAAGSTEDAETAHVYTLTVSVRLATDAVTGEATADPGQLECAAGQTPGGATTGLFNVATLDPLGHADIVDDECGELPLVTLDKTVVSEPSVVDRENEPGVWEVVYGLAVTNETDVETDYDLTDRLRFGSAVEIESVTVENTGPGDIDTDAGYDGVDEVSIVTDEPIGGGDVHSYEVTVRYSFMLPNPPEQPDASDCSLVEGGEDGTGLLNGAATSFNGYPDYDTECRELGQVTHDKTLVSATPIGDGRWQVEYDVTVSNKGVGATLYDLDDTLRYTDQATIVSAVVTSGPDGVTLADPVWDGQDATRIATAVAMPGNDDAGYAAHVYRLTVVAEVPLQLDGAGSGDESDPALCAVEGLDASVSRALTNTSTLTDEAGVTEDDAACAELPSIDIAKSVSAGPVRDGSGAWVITYDIVATNAGGADGTYTLTDRLRFGTGIAVSSAQVIAAPEGVTPAATWTGHGADDGDPANVVATDVTLAAGGEHTYRVQVVATAGGAAVTSSVFDCPAPGSDASGGFANTASISHNGLADTADACAEPYRPAPIAPGSIASTGVDSGPVAIAGALLLLLGGLVLIGRRRGKRVSA